MSWEKEVEEIRRREKLAAQMGGEERVSRHRKAGKLTVRERIERLLDRDSFHETGALAGKATYEDGELVDFTPSNFVMGRGPSMVAPSWLAATTLPFAGAPKMGLSEIKWVTARKWPANFDCLS